MVVLSGMGMDAIVQVITVLLIFVFVLAVTYFVTHWIATFQKSKLATGSIEVVETQRIAQNRYVQIVRIGEKYFALGIGKEEVQILCEVPKEEIHLNKDEKQSFPDFKKIFNNAKKS